MKSVKTLLAVLVAGSAMLAGPVMGDDHKKEQKQEQKQERKQEGKKDDKGYGDKSKDKKDEKKDDKKSSTAAVGSPAPEFKLTDTTGKEHTLSSLTKEGKTVVLQWFNPDCPFVVKHHEKFTTFNDLHAKYSPRGVVFLAINSGAAGKQGAGKDRNAKAVTDWKMPYPVLLDESGAVGKAYGAKRTPEMYIITKDGLLAYHGAIDDNPSADEAGKVNYVAKALDEILAGQSVSTATTRAYGCTVKYAD